MGCTLEPMNKNPVTVAMADDHHLVGFVGCAKSLPSALGTKNPGPNTGTHSAPNFDISLEFTQ